MALSAPPISTPPFLEPQNGNGPQWAPVWTAWLQQLQKETLANAAAAAAALAAAGSGGGGGGGTVPGPPGPPGPAGIGVPGPAGPAGAPGANGTQTVTVAVAGPTTILPPDVSAENELLVVFVTQSTPGSAVTWGVIVGSVFKRPPPIPLGDGMLSVILFAGRSDGNWYYLSSMLGVHV